MMKLKQSILLLFFLTVFSQQVTAQDWKFGLNFNVGIENFGDLPTSNVVIYTEEFRPYYSLGALSQLFFYEGYFGELGLNLNYSHRKYQWDNISPMDLGLDVFRLKINRHTYYLSAPLSVGCKLKWFSLKVGLQFTHATIIDDSQSGRYFQFLGASEFEKIGEYEEDYQRFYVEPAFQIAASIQQHLDLHLSLIHNPKNEDYRSLFPKYRYAFGIIYFP